MNRRKRLTALMLALAMCLSVLPANVLATELGGEAEAAEVAAPEDSSEATEAEEPQAAEIGEQDEDVSPSTMAATSGKCGKNAKWSYNSKTKTLTISGKGAMCNYPSTVLDPEDDDEELPWHEAQLAIDKIIIKKGITSIGSYAFSNTYPKSVTIPNTVTSIGKYAFATYCNEKLKKIQIPESVKNIGAYAFEGQLGLTKVIISENVKQINKGAFRWTHISKVYFKGDAPNIDKEAFEVFDKYGENLQPITFYYPKGNETWTDNKKKNYGAEQATWKTWTPYEKPDFFVLGKDSNSYKHSSVAFGLSSDKKSCTKYTEDSIGKTYPTALKLYSKLLTGINGIKEEAKLQEDMSEEWGGSCLGLTLSMIMAKNGRLDVSKFRMNKINGNTKCYYALYPPAQNLELRNLISYYYLLQKANQFPVTQATYNSIWDKRDGLVSGKPNTKWAEFWVNFYEEVKKASDQKKSILFSYNADDSVHVILTCGYDDSNPDYMIIRLFDCNTVGAEFSPGNNSHQNVLEKGCYSYIYISKTSKKFKNDEDFYMVYATPWGNSSYGIEHNNWHFFFYTSLIDLNKIDAADEYYRSPYATKLLSVKSRPSKTIKVTWLKRENVLGYEVQCDTSTKFKNRRSVIIQKENANSTTISKLKKGKKYYVRIRTYKTVSGKTYYSSWSKLKSTIVKK